MILIGGLGSVVGSIFGAVFLILLPQVTDHYGAIRQIIFGGIVMVEGIKNAGGNGPSPSAAAG